MRQYNRDKHDLIEDKDVICCLDYDRGWLDEDSPGSMIHKKCYKLNFDENSFFRVCEALILHRLDTQAHRNTQVMKNGVKAMLEKANRDLEQCIDKFLIESNFFESPEQMLKYKLKLCERELQKQRDLLKAN